jgi:hypothetical protein
MSEARTRAGASAAGASPGEEGRGAGLALAAVLALLLGAVFCVGYLPTQDGPQHVFTVHARAHLDDPATGWGDWLEASTPLTNHGFGLLFAPLDAFLPWQTALSLALGAMVALWAVGAFALAKAVAPQRAWLGVALAAAALQWSLYMGLFSFHIATGFGLLVCALAWSRPWNRPLRAMLAGLLLVQALLHVVPAIVSGFAIAVLGLCRAGRGGRLREATRIALMGAPAACVALALALAGLEELARHHPGGSDASSFAPAPWWALGRCFTSGPAWRAWPPALLGTATLAAWAAVRRLPRRPEDRALLISGAVLLAAALFAPLHIPAWDFFSVRFLPVATCALVVATPLERVRTAGGRRAVAAACVAWSLAATVWAIFHHRDLAARAADALAGLEIPLDRAGPRLPIVLDPYLGRPLDDRLAPVPFAVPLLNLGQLYAVAQGGLPPYGFYVSPHIHAVVLREGARERYPKTVDRRYAAELAVPARADDAELRRAVLAYVGGHAPGYEDVILWGRADDAERLLELGFEAIWQRGGLLLARFEGCPFTLAFPPGSDVRGHTVVEIGWHPSWHVTRRYAVGGARRGAGGRLLLPLRETPCGALWVRLDDEGRACEGADEEGRLLVPSTEATPLVECRVLRPTLTAER